MAERKGWCNRRPPVLPTAGGLMRFTGRIRVSNFRNYGKSLFSYFNFSFFNNNNFFIRFKRLLADTFHLHNIFRLLKRAVSLPVLHYPLGVLGTYSVKISEFFNRSSSSLLECGDSSPLSFNVRLPPQETPHLRVLCCTARIEVVYFRTTPIQKNTQGQCAAARSNSLVWQTVSVS